MEETQRYRGEVMVVEDDFAIRETLRELLEEEGYGVVEASNGVEALARLRGDKAPRLILLDLMMPVMDGWQFRDVLEHDPKLASIPVIVISADHGLEEKVGEMRVEGYLAKPFELDRLLATIERYAELPS
jgi:CheY-like chemotaxis protein